MSYFTTFIQHCILCSIYIPYSMEIGANVVRQEKKIHTRQSNWKESKIISHHRQHDWRNMTDSTNKPLEFVIFTNFAEYKSNIWKSIVFLCTSTVTTIRKWNLKITYNSIKNMKFLRINLTKYIKRFVHWKFKN